MLPRPLIASGEFDDLVLVLPAVVVIAGRLSDTGAALGAVGVRTPMRRFIHAAVVALLVSTPAQACPFTSHLRPDQRAQADSVIIGRFVEWSAEVIPDSSPRVPFVRERARHEPACLDSH